mmetsp:Transcript_14153/g.40468  ORF Transcript_14153/g.40468 Transcript_14153/m.40468 type:complete len:366 (+) Transcript_14153:1006-2103(+)
MCMEPDRAWLGDSCATGDLAGHRAHGPPGVPTKGSGAGGAEAAGCRPPARPECRHAAGTARARVLGGGHAGERGRRGLQRHRALHEFDSASGRVGRSRERPEGRRRRPHRRHGGACRGARRGGKGGGLQRLLHGDRQRRGRGCRPHAGRRGGVRHAGSARRREHPRGNPASTGWQALGRGGRRVGRRHVQPPGGGCAGGRGRLRGRGRGLRPGGGRARLGGRAAGRGHGVLRHHRRIAQRVKLGYQEGLLPGGAPGPSGQEPGRPGGKPEVPGPRAGVPGPQRPEAAGALRPAGQGGRERRRAPLHRPRALLQHALRLGAVREVHRQALLGHADGPHRKGPAARHGPADEGRHQLRRDAGAGRHR